MTERPRPHNVLITGSNRGTGRAIAEAMHRAGWNIVSLNRTLTGEDRLGEIQCDLADGAAIDAAIDEVKAKVDQLHACVLNAAIRRLQPLAMLPASDMAESVAVNLLAPFRLVQATLPLVRAAGGMYVVMGSHAGTYYFEGGAAYCATKAALKALVEVLLLEERREGVRTVLVSAGAIANRAGDASPMKMSAESVGQFVRDLITRTPSDVAVGEVEIRPARLEVPALSGLSRLQHV